MPEHLRPVSNDLLPFPCQPILAQILMQVLPKARASREPATLSTTRPTNDTVPLPIGALYDFPKGPPNWREFRREFTDFAEQKLKGAPLTTQKNILALSLAGPPRRAIPTLRAKQLDGTTDLNQYLHKIELATYGQAHLADRRTAFFQCQQLLHETFTSFAGHLDATFCLAFFNTGVSHPRTKAERAVFNCLLVDAFIRGIRCPDIKEEVFNLQPTTVGDAIAQAESATFNLISRRTSQPAKSPDNNNTSRVCWTCSDCQNTIEELAQLARQALRINSGSPVNVDGLLAQAPCQHRRTIVPPVDLDTLPSIANLTRDEFQALLPMQEIDSSSLQAILGTEYDFQSDSQDNISTPRMRTPAPISQSDSNESLSHGTSPARNTCKTPPAVVRSPYWPSPGQP